MKRIISLILCFVLFVCMFPVSSFAEEPEQITMGRYNHADSEYDPLALDWLLMDVSEDGTKGLLVSFYTLEVRQFNLYKNCTWETSEIREWLNGIFYEQAFSEEEKQIILTTVVYNDASHNVSGWQTDGGRTTQDKVFLLSASEYMRYFKNVLNFPYTDHAKSVAKTKKETGPQWLRSPGEKTGEACIANNGKVYSQAVDKLAGVCPAIWIDLTADRSDFPFERWMKAQEYLESEDYQNAYSLFDDLGIYMYSNGYVMLIALKNLNDYFEKLEETDECDWEEIIRLIADFQALCARKNVNFEEEFGADLSEAITGTYYLAAVEAQKAGNYDRAIELYKMVGNFEDAIDRLLQCYDATGINYAYINAKPVDAGYRVGYKNTNAVTSKNLQYGWRLGRFIITGYTEEENGVYLKTLGDEVTLIYDIDQDINALNGNPKMFIAEDNEARDDPFGYDEKGASFGQGALLVQFDEHAHHDKTLIPPYTNYLAANDAGVANTSIEINEEGTYEVALDYLIRTSGFGGKTEGYRTYFTFEVKNGDGIAFLRDVTTQYELQNYSVTENGFFVDFGKSNAIKVYITRQNININGTALDTREDRPVSSDKHFTKHGYYIIQMTNTETQRTVTKHIFVGTQAELFEFIKIDPSLGPFDKLGS